MKYTYHILSLLYLLMLATSCLHQPNETNISQNIKQYEDQVGDTPFDPLLDEATFKLCDSSSVIHKRQWVKYDGGAKAITKELQNNYKPKANYESYNGYFIIRFIVNCEDKTGRFRMQSFDKDYKLSSNTPKGLDQHILDLAKNLKGWEHAFFDNMHKDSYRFITIKMVNGQIL